jgi:hypothetical protein
MTRWTDVLKTGFASRFLGRDRRDRRLLRFLEIGRLAIDLLLPLVPGEASRCRRLYGLDVLVARSADTQREPVTTQFVLFVVIVGRDKILFCTWTRLRAADARIG